MLIALSCVLIAGLMPYFWVIVSKATGKRYDNRNVRAWQARLEGLPLRAHNAHLNSFEAFPLFAAAVLAAIATHADLQLTAWLAMAFVAVRLAYGAAYLADMPRLRSLVWFAGQAIVVAIFVGAIRAVP